MNESFRYPRLWGSHYPAPEDVRQFFDRFLERDSGDQSNVVTSQWAPSVDVREEDQRFVIEADIPGVEPKDIEINMDKGVLSIRGERKSEHKETDGKYSRIERSHGVFHRRFALPDSADASGIHASGKNGTLEIVIPKRPETTPRKIEVKID